MVGNDIACDILVRHFRRLGLNVDAVNDEGFTALLCAAKHGNVTCAQILIGHGKASIRHRDQIHNLSVEEWLQKKGFSLQDVTPFIRDGKGRSRFVKFGNIAAICSGTKKLAQLAKQPSREYEYPINSLRLEDFRDVEEGYVSDATTITDVSTSRYYTYNDQFTDEWYQDQAVDTIIHPYPTTKPNMVTEETQTSDTDSDPETTRSHFRGELHRRHRHNGNRSLDENYFPVSQRSDDSYNKGSSDKRLSLPDIGGTGKGGYGRGSLAKDRKQSLQVLPEILIANVDLGDGRRKNIQLRSDPLRNKFYWKPCVDEDDEDNLTNIMNDMSLDKKQASDSETSVAEEGSVF